VEALWRDIAIGDLHLYVALEALTTIIVTASREAKDLLKLIHAYGALFFFTQVFCRGEKQMAIFCLLFLRLVSGHHFSSSF